MGLHELAEAAGVGLLIEEERIHVLPECRKLCAEFELDPLGTIASGALLITLPAEQAEGLVAVLDSQHIAASVIGQVQPVQAGVKLQVGESIVDLPRFAQDEIAKLFA